MDLNIRRVDRESVMELKSHALALGMTLRELCIQKLGIGGERLKVGDAKANTGSGEGLSKAGATEKIVHRRSFPNPPCPKCKMIMEDLGTVFSCGTEGCSQKPIPAETVEYQWEDRGLNG